MYKNISRLTNVFILRHRLLIILVALILLLITFPIVHDKFSPFLLILEIFITILMVLGLYIIGATNRTVTVAVLIALLAFTTIGFNVLLQSKNLLIMGLALEITFFSLTVTTIIRHVLTYKKVTADKIYGAICAYLLIGIIWALIYTLLENAMPNSFTFAHGVSLDYEHVFSYRFYFGPFIYYSFVTLTTLGYGDIVPIAIPAQVFSALEAVIGQLYVAVLIARLVGLHITHTHWFRKNIK
jgi:voltage-gated potassium channel